MDLKWPAYHSEVFRTPTDGVSYLKGPGVVLIAQPRVNLANVQGFLDGFDRELEFNPYLSDPTPLTDSEQLSKFAGQLCFMSFGPKRTLNTDAREYFDGGPKQFGIKPSGHGSLLEHPNYSVLIYGASRSYTHEHVRHRAGKGYSQVSQRFVSGRTLRFVEKASFQRIPRLHEKFLHRIELLAREYHEIAEILYEEQARGLDILSGERKTELRKKVQQDARECLPNETEAPIVVTGNARAWRHFLEMRAAAGAETQIRAVAVLVYRCLAEVAPVLYDDYELVRLEDGTEAVKTPYRKV